MRRRAHQVCIRAADAEEARRKARFELDGFPQCSVVLCSPPGDPDWRSRFYVTRGVE